MKIAHVTPYFPPIVGGIETYVYELVTRLARVCDVEVFTCGRGITERVGRVVVHRLRAIDIRNMPFNLKIPYPIPPTLMFHLARSESDIIHVHGHAFLTTFEGALAARITKKPLVMTIHDIGVAYMDYKFIRGIRPFVDSIPVQASINWSDIVIAQNFVTRDYISQFKPKRIVVIPPGVNMERFKPVDNQGRYITFIAARLVKLKGDEVFLKAIPFILKETKDVEFRIIGGGVREKYLKELAKKLGVSGHVEFIGPVPHEEVPKYLAEAKIVVCPGAPAGLILLEAAAMKKPIITVYHEWSEEALGNTVFYVPPNNPKKLSEFVLYALKNSNVRNRLAEAAYEKVKSERSWKTVALRHLEIYESLLSSSHKWA